jgi:hypothetical protein
VTPKVAFWPAGIVALAGWEEIWGVGFTASRTTIDWLPTVQVPETVEAAPAAQALAAASEALLVSMTLAQFAPAGAAGSVKATDDVAMLLRTMKSLSDTWSPWT